VSSFDKFTICIIEFFNFEFLYDEPILKYALQKDSTFGEIELLPVKFDVQFHAFGLPKTHINLEQLISQRILEIIVTEEWDIALNE
jgi:hypothetical protein